MPNHLLGTDPATLPPAFAPAARRAAGPLDDLPAPRRSSPWSASSAATSRAPAGRITGPRAASRGSPSRRACARATGWPAPIFTPSTKAEAGHDEPIDFDAVVGLVGGERAEAVRDIALARLRAGARRSARGPGSSSPTRSSRSAWTPAAGELVLADEVLTPDSSRFWDAAAWEPGRAQASYDKQFVRDWLDGQPWDKTPPGPGLPADVVAGTRARYVAAFERITGASFARYLEEDVVAP